MNPLNLEKRDQTISKRGKLVNELAAKMQIDAIWTSRGGREARASFKRGDIKSGKS